jgi:hypothetical protein
LSRRREAKEPLVVSMQVVRVQARARKRGSLIILRIFKTGSKT